MTEESEFHERQRRKICAARMDTLNDSARITARSKTPRARPSAVKRE